VVGEQAALGLGALTREEGEGVMRHGLTPLALLLMAVPLVAQTPPGPPAQQNVTVDAATRARVIDAAVAKLNQYYVFPETAQRMAEAVQTRLARGAYDTITGGNAFASALTTDLRAVSHDKHLSVAFSSRVLPPMDPDATPDSAVTAQRRAMLLRNNCAFERVEWLSSNIGYLKFNAFGETAVCAATVTAAMTFLAHVDALIIDLRNNGGGDPEMVAWVSSYLFAEPTHLNDLYDRAADKTTEYWTSRDAPGPRLADTPVFILTSSRTFSAAEEFAYNLKNLKRATIVGETTGGGAHPVAGHRIDDHFTIRVPFARAINPISKTNWEGTGVVPDVPVPANEALDTARRLAAEQRRAGLTP
jgi:hypothetical protein